MSVKNLIAALLTEKDNARALAERLAAREAAVEASIHPDDRRLLVVGRRDNTWVVRWVDTAPRFGFAPVSGDALNEFKALQDGVEMDPYVYD